MGVALLKTERDGGRSTSYSLMMSISHDTIRRQSRNGTEAQKCSAGPGHAPPKKAHKHGDGACVCTGVLTPSLTGRKAASRGRVCPHS